MTIQQIINKNKRSIGIVMAFALVENIAWIIEPTFFGKLLDAMIGHFYQKEKVNYVLPLLLWIVIYLVNTLGGSLSRLFSGKIYSKMYAAVVSDVIIFSKKQGHSVSSTFAYSDLAKDYMVFLKDRLPEVTWQFMATFGAIFALIFYDWRIAAICAVVIYPIVFVNNKYRKNVTILQKELHDTKEDVYKLLEMKNTTKIQEFFYSMVVPQSKIAVWNSADYLAGKVMLMIVFVVILFICVDVDDFTTGKIYSVVSYLWTFISSTEYLPGLMESLSSVGELNERFKEEV